MHFPVAGTVVRVAAGRVQDDCAARLARGCVDADLTALQLESAVNGVHRGTKREIYFRRGGIEFDGDLLRAKGGSKNSQ